MRIQLRRLAHARSGDKGDTVNVGVIAYDDAHYPFLSEALTIDRVKSHFKDMVGEVERFELPNLGALNFLLHEALDGGGTVSLMTDAQGKTYSTAMLRMELDVPEEIAEGLPPEGSTDRGRAAAGGRHGRGQPPDGGRHVSAARPPTEDVT